MNHGCIHPLTTRFHLPMAQVGEVSIGELLTTVRGGFKIYKCYLQGSSPRKGPDHEVLLGLEKIGKLLGPSKRGTKTDKNSNKNSEHRKKWNMSEVFSCFFFKGWIQELVKIKHRKHVISFVEILFFCVGFGYLILFAAWLKYHYGIISLDRITVAVRSKRVNCIIFLGKHCFRPHFFRWKPSDSNIYLGDLTLHKLGGVLKDRFRIHNFYKNMGDS